MEKAQQRLRVIFSKGRELRYISHLDLMRLWERALRRAGIPLAYSQGYNPRPKIALASPLALGIVSKCEVMDLFLEHRVSSLTFTKRLDKELPQGSEILSVEEVDLTLPSLQSQVRFSEYRVMIESSLPEECVKERLERALAASSLPRRREKKGKSKEYDLRPLIEALWVEEKCDDHLALVMRLHTGSRETARPDEVLDILGLGEAPSFIQRERLMFEFDKK